MIRFIISFNLFIILCLHCPSVSAQANAFSAMSSDISVQANPAMRRFLQGIAIRLRKDWGPKLESKSPSVLATFLIEPKRAWRVYPSSISDKAQVHEMELVEKELKGTDPPSKESFRVLFVFDSWPANHSIAANDKQIASITKRTVDVVPNVVAQQDVDFGPYMARLQQRVTSNWILSKEPQKKTKAIAVFTLNKDGSIKEIHLTAKSGFADYDNAALNAVKKSAPFLSFPYGSPDTVDIQYTFEHHLCPKLKNHTPKRFTIHLSQPDVVITESAVFENLGHFKKF